ncbi:MAG: hypothetical protein ACLP01_18445 [Solirubrobacteraceae bacterium]
MTAEVLIVTNERDLDADRVISELGHRGVGVLRCNTERLTDWSVEVDVPYRWQLIDPFGRSATSDTVSAIWWRRPEPPSTGLGSLTAGPRQALDDQWQALLEGLASVPGPRWVSNPLSVRRAEDKLFQLRTASEVGFQVPETVVVNGLDAATAFLARRNGQAVAKSLTAAHWENEREAAFVFAKLIDQESLPTDPAALRRAPVMLQEAIMPKRDVRATVIGERVLAAETSPTLVEIDWRLEPERAWHQRELEPAALARCCRLVAALGLRFAGIDLAIAEDDTVWFLEANPNGEWGWLVDAASLPVPSALADELAS